jgi:hypothetical protein
MKKFISPQPVNVKMKFSSKISLLRAKKKYDHKEEEDGQNKKIEYFIFMYEYVIIVSKTMFVVPH